MTKKGMLLSAAAGAAAIAVIAAGVTLAARQTGSAKAAADRWAEAANSMDVALLDAALSKDDVVRAYTEQLTASTLSMIEEDPDAAGFAPAVILELQTASLAALARDYASPRGTRGLLLRCDPRTQTDEGMAATPSVSFVVQPVDDSRAELSCEMSGSGGARIRAIMERRDRAPWVITRVELPLPMPAWAGPA